jgi:hypothetical protein
MKNFLMLNQSRKIWKVLKYGAGEEDGKKLVGPIV